MKDKEELDKLYNKYKIKNNFIIERVARKTIRFIEANTINYPTTYKVLRDNTISSCYSILEWIYKSNLTQNINDKYEIVVNIQMLNFYLEEAYNKKILNKKKLISYTNHLIEIDKMIRSWFNYEKSK